MLRKRQSFKNNNDAGFLIQNSSSLICSDIKRSRVLRKFNRFIYLLIHKNPGMSFKKKYRGSIKV